MLIKSSSFCYFYLIIWNINNGDSCSLISLESCSLLKLSGSCGRFHLQVLTLSNQIQILTVDFFSSAKKQPIKTFSDIKGLIQQGKKREVKLMIRETPWPVNSTIRAQLWPELCAQHHHGKNMLDGFYWDMVNQVRKQRCLLDSRANYTIKSRFLEQQNFQRSR